MKRITAVKEGPWEMNHYSSRRGTLTTIHEMGPISIGEKEQVGIKREIIGYGIKLKGEMK